MKKFLIAGLCVLICGAAIATEVSKTETKDETQGAAEQVLTPPEIQQQENADGEKKLNTRIKKIDLVQISCSKFGAYAECTKNPISVETTDNPENLTWYEANNVCEAKGLRLPTASELHSMLMAAQEGIIHPFQSANYWADSVDNDISNICYMGFGNCAKRNKQESLLPFRCVEK